MSSEDLKKLSKDELINTITDLKNKIAAEESEISQFIRHRDLLESISDIIFVLDKNENLVYLNSAWRILFPSRKNETVGRHYENYIPVSEKERAGFVFSKVISEGAVFENELLKTFDESGNVLYFSTSFFPIISDSGEIKGLVGIMKNITERFLAQRKFKESSRALEGKIKEQLSQSEELKNLRDLNEEILNNAPIGIFMMDPSGVMLSENPSLTEIMGRQPGETVVGVNLLEYSGFVEGGFARLFEQTLNEKKRMRATNARYVPLSGGKEIIINVTMDPIFGKGGNVEKAIIMVEDVTEQAQIMKRMNRVEKISALGVLSSGVALELRNYINKMVMDLNFVEKNVDESNPAADYVDSLQSDIERIKNISEQLLSLSVVDESAKEVCEINKLFTTHPVDVFLKRIKNDGIEVEFIASPEDPVVNATHNQLEQVVLQFLENAEEAVSNDGKITISTSVTGKENEKYAVITITDNGIGIPEENIKKIFQPFFTTKGKSATGLGMMIVSTIIENLGGYIGIKSKPGEGTSIRIALPQEKTA